MGWLFIIVLGGLLLSESPALGHEVLCETEPVSSWGCTYELNDEGEPVPSQDSSEASWGCRDWGRHPTILAHACEDNACEYTHTCTATVENSCPQPTNETWISFFNRACRSSVPPPPAPEANTGSGGNAGGSRSSGPSVVTESVPVGFLENPGDGSYQSGIGLISGWICDADEVIVEFDGDRQSRVPAIYGTSRSDTQEICGDSDNGFGLLFNWNLLGDGAHIVTMYVDGEPWRSAAFTVTTLGEEFARSLFGMCVVEDFPSPGEEVTLEWQESSQNFVVVDVE